MPLYSHSFSAVTPFARYGDVGAWVNVLVEETPSAGGPFTQIASLALPVDATPDDPDPVDLTIETATIPAGYFRFRFEDADGVLSPYTDAIFSPNEAGGAFATVSDIAIRMGRDLTAAEEGQASLLLTFVTNLIAGEVNKTAEWAATLSPIPTRLRVVAIEATVRVLQNPLAVRSVQEQLGAHSQSRSYADVSAGLQLTDQECRDVRRAVHGSGTASVQTGSIVDNLRRDRGSGLEVVEATTDEA